MPSISKQTLEELLDTIDFSLPEKIREYFLNNEKFINVSSNKKKAAKKALREKRYYFENNKLFMFVFYCC